MTTCWCAVEYSLCVLPSDYCKFFVHRCWTLYSVSASSRPLRSRDGVNRCLTGVVENYETRRTTTSGSFLFFCLMCIRVCVCVCMCVSQRIAIWFSVRGRLSGSEGLRTFPGVRSSGRIVRSILASAFLSPPPTGLTLLLLRRPLQVSSRHEVATLPDSVPRFFESSHPPTKPHHFDLRFLSRAERAPTWRSLFRSILHPWSGDSSAGNASWLTLWFERLLLRQKGSSTSCMHRLADENDNLAFSLAVLFFFFRRGEGESCDWD